MTDKEKIQRIRKLIARFDKLPIADQNKSAYMNYFQLIRYAVDQDGEDEDDPLEVMNKRIDALSKEVRQLSKNIDYFEERIDEVEGEISTF